MKRILITGAGGQLGNELRTLSSDAGCEFHFVGREEFNLSDLNSIHKFLSAHSFDYIINTAAYTGVDKAESEKEAAMQVNATAPGHIAQICVEKKIKLIHFSTDFVFDGTVARPLHENDTTNPINQYGATKLAGESAVMQHCPEAVIIRTSWVYSSFGNNFVKTILRLCKERESLNIIYDQVGTPTYARDLAEAVLSLTGKDWVPGIYHYSNEGVASWYDFAIAIRDVAGLKTPIYPIESSQYPTPATRPKFSVLSKTKFKDTFHLPVPYWRHSLEKCMALLK